MIATKFTTNVTMGFLLRYLTIKPAGMQSDKRSHLHDSRRTLPRGIKSARRSHCHERCRTRLIWWSIAGSHNLRVLDCLFLLILFQDPYQRRLVSGFYILLISAPM